MHHRRPRYGPSILAQRLPELPRRERRWVEVLLAQVANDERKQVVFASVPAEATSQTVERFSLGGAARRRYRGRLRSSGPRW